MAKKEFTGTGESIFADIRREGGPVVEASDNKPTARIPLDIAIDPRSTREEIESSLTEIRRGQDMSDIAICIAIGRIEYDGMWRYETKQSGEGPIKTDSRYKTAREYFDELADKLGVGVGTMATYRKGGENWHRYKKPLSLEAINFRERGDLGKLTLLDKLAAGMESGSLDKNTIKKALQAGKLADIKALISSVTPPSEEQKLELVTGDSKVSVSRGSIKVDDALVATLEPDGREFEKIIVGSIREEVRRKETGLIPVTVEVAPDEVPLFEKDIARLRTIRDKKRRAIILEVDADVDEKGLVAAAQKNVDEFVKKYWSKR